MYKRQGLKKELLGNAVRSDSIETVQLMSNYCGISYEFIGLAEERGVEDIIDFLKKDSKKSKEMKENMKNAIKENKARIFHLVPRMREFPYSEKYKKLSPLLEDNPVSYKKLLNELLVPEVHVGQKIQKCPEYTCFVKDLSTISMIFGS